MDYAKLDALLNEQRRDLEQERLERLAREAREAKTLRTAMQGLMETEDGATLVRWLLDISGVFKAGWVENQSYAAFLEGKRTVGAEVLRLAQRAGVADKLLAVLE